MAGAAWLGWIALVVILAYGGWAGWHFYNAKRQGLPAPPLKSYIPFVGKGSASSTTNYPTPRARNLIEWVKDQFAKLRNKRTHQGAYEESGDREAGYSNTGLASTTRGRTRGGAGLEDDAWDTRVGNEDPYATGGPGHNTTTTGGLGGYYEEQELGLTPTPGYVQDPFGSGATDYMSQNTSYGGGGLHSASNDKGKGPVDRNRNLTATDGNSDPFGDEHAAPSLRSVSPRPAELDTSSHRKARDNASLDSTHGSPTSMRKSHFREDMN